MAYFGEYVSVASRRALAKREVAKLRKQGLQADPVEIEGTAISRTFWGKSWCRHLESFSDYSNRLPRGRSYVRHGSVCHLAIESGAIVGVVSGSYLYDVKVSVTGLGSETWATLKERCSGQIASMLELLDGKLSKHVMEIVCDRDSGLFPKPREIKLSCSCPDGARMCKHLAAVMYGVGHRLDRDPELLFLLRGVDPIELLANPVSVTAGEGDDTLAADDLAGIFGIEMDFDIPPSPLGAKAKAVAEKARSGPKAKPAKKAARSTDSPVARSIGPIRPSNP